MQSAKYCQGKMSYNDIYVEFKHIKWQHCVNDVLSSLISNCLNIEFLNKNPY